MNQIKSICLTCTTLILLSCGGADSTDTLTVSITVDKLPDTVDVNKATQEVFEKYSWEVHFDINNDGIENEGDLELSMKHISPTGSTPENLPIQNIQAGLWAKQFTGSAQLLNVTVKKQITGNTITLSVNKSDHPVLAKITDNMKIQCQTYYFDGAPSYFPNINSDFLGAMNYQEMTDDRTFSDIRGDVKYPLIDIIKLVISF